MSTYNLKTDSPAFRITKFDDDLNVAASYRVSPTECECPQWVERQRTCRHMKMLPLMEDRADTDWYLDYDKGTWSQPFEPLPPPEGVTVLTLDDPEAVHNAIADALGEPRLQPKRELGPTDRIRRI
jgi:hypothetical protein